MAENFVNIIREIRGSTNDPATDTSCIYGDIKSMHEEYEGFNQITDEERLKLENIEEGATKNSTDGFLLSRQNHTGNMSIANVQDTPSRMAMTIHEKNKLEAIPGNATANDTDANLRNRDTHTGTQSIDTITDTLTHVKMNVSERSKLSEIATGATKNATDAELRSRSTHTGTQSADTIVDGLVNAAYTLDEKNKLSVLNTTVPPAHTHDNTSIMSLSYSKLTGVPETFYPSEHLHSMSEITTGNLDATRINQTNSLQFVNIIEKEKIAHAESMNNKGTPFGYAPLDGNGKINPSYLDSLNVIDVFTPINQEAMLLLTSAKPGDIAYVQDSQNTYMLVALPVHLIDNWKQMNSGSGVMTLNGLSGIVSVGTDEIPEGSANVYFTNERVDDRVANLLAPGANVSMVYNDDTNQIIISANDTSVEWSEIQNKPNTKIDVNLSGDISGSGSVTLSQLGDGTLNIANMTLESAGTAGIYTKVTTNTKGQVVAGTSLSAGDIPSLDASKITSGIIDIDRLPSTAGSIPEYATLSEFPLVGDSGKVYIALDTNKMYRWSGSAYVSIAGGVDSVSGKTGEVHLTKEDVGLANVDNTSDINKPISTATQTALNTKVDTATNQTIAGVKTFSSNPISTATQSTEANALTRKDYVDSKLSSFIPAGLISMWSGSIASIPSGWALCNGANGTPDLRNRFVIGASADVSGVSNTGVTGANTKTGGSKDAIVVSHTHTQAAHNHTFTTDASGIHSHTASTGSAGAHTHTTSNIVTSTGGINGWAVYGGSYNLGGTGTSSSAGAHSHTVSVNNSAAHTHTGKTTTVTPAINNTGVAGTNANLPPYYALAYIMKL